MKPAVDHFWEHAAPHEFSAAQWEALCDNCGRCCLQKYQSATTGKIYYTWIACYLLDVDTCRCTQYELRHVLVPDCIELTAQNITRLRWLPVTCAYRLMAEGKSLPPWHPLISGDPGSVRQAGISVSGRVVSETLVHPDDVDNFRVKGKEKFW